jgi:hypothetical protein
MIGRERQQEAKIGETRELDGGKDSEIEAENVSQRGN